MRECGDVLGVNRKLAQEKRTGKHILEYIFFQLVEFKKSCQVYEVISMLYIMKGICSLYRNHDHYYNTVRAVKLWSLV